MVVEAEVVLAKIGGGSGVEREPVNVDKVLSIDIKVDNTLFRVSTEKGGLRVQMNGKMSILPLASNVARIVEGDWDE